MAGKAGERGLDLPPGYGLDISDADVWFLRRRDGSEVAAFSASGCDPRPIEEAARNDVSGRRAWAGNTLCCGCARISTLARGPAARIVAGWPTRNDSRARA